jgi:hypothetical protein
VYDDDDTNLGTNFRTTGKEGPHRITGGVAVSTLIKSEETLFLFLKNKKGAWLWLDEIDNEELDENTYVVVIR